MTQGAQIQTVGDLIERLGEFDPATPVRVQQAVDGKPEFILTVDYSPDEPGIVAIAYVPAP